MLFRSFNPALLFIDCTWWQGVQVVITSLIGVYGVAAGLRGYAFDHLNTVMRLVIIAGGLLLIDAGAVTDIVGIIIVVGISAFQQINKKRNLAG